MRRRRDDDGRPDLQVRDTNADGRIDYEAEDLDGDGRIDRYIADTNYDGVPDRFSGHESGHQADQNTGEGRIHRADS